MQRKLGATIAAEAVEQSASADGQPEIIEALLLHSLASRLRRHALDGVRRRNSSLRASR